MDALGNSDIHMNVPEVSGWIRKKTVKSLMGTLRDRTANFDDRLRAIEALVQIGSGDAVIPLTEALKDRDPNIRLKVAEALGRMGNESSVESLTRLGAIRVWNKPLRGEVGSVEVPPGKVQAAHK